MGKVTVGMLEEDGTMFGDNGVDLWGESNSGQEQFYLYNGHVYNVTRRYADDRTWVKHLGTAEKFLKDHDEDAALAVALRNVM